MKKTKILIVDDHAVVRAGLSTILGYEDDFAVIGEAADGAEAVRAAAKLRPDIAIVDFAMPKMDGAETTRRIRSESPDTRVILLTTYSSPDDISRALKAGAAGVLFKTAANDTLTDMIRRVTAGETVLPQEIRRMLEEQQTTPVFTERQLAVLQSVSRGLTNDDIALQFGISRSAVKQHLSAIFTKLGAASRPEAVTIALRRQILKI